jgi:Competence protein CoiA-like family
MFFHVRRSLPSMLVAYGPNCQPVIAEETALELLQQWSHERMLFCPNCRGVVHVRGGPEKRTQLHFAHQKGECAWSTESESVRHARGKMVLAHWLHEQFPQATVTLEERLPEPNRIADVFLTHADGQRWAIEFQCAPLEIEEWWHRHEAYRKAGIIDVWIVGANRREKQEAFIEAILAEAHEVMFLDPLVSPARIWLRWPIPRHTAQEWQQTNKVAPALDGWVGRLGYGATLIGRLYEIHLNEQASLMHPVRTAMETRARLLQTMSEASTVDESVLAAYLRQRTSEDVIGCVVLPLMRAYLRDPDLLRRYNYGRGLLDQPLSESDRMRVQKGREWLSSLEQRGFPLERLKEIVNEIPFVGPYAAFAGYAETLISLL